MDNIFHAPDIYRTFEKKYQDRLTTYISQKNGIFDSAHDFGKF